MATQSGAPTQSAAPAPSAVPAQAAASQTFEVTISTDGHAQTDSVKVSRSGRDKVKWTAVRGGGPWRVTFDKGDGSPFSPEYTFDVPANGSVVTNATNTAAELKRHRYRVRDGNPPYNERHDPDVDVES
jgi:hypothetical protein